MIRGTLLVIFCLLMASCSPQEKFYVCSDQEGDSFGVSVSKTTLKFLNQQYPYEKDIGVVSYYGTAPERAMFDPVSKTLYIKVIDRLERLRCKDIDAPPKK